ncbi:hypothetical protein [Streptomyces sp. N2A]|uniref:hypothetical protein n=1 Tax=Streptomyces sp. N2A TaxID=3073936 RepID=UPI0028701319|nr:hypothetical protein [Streptomyces sp. N2A]
MAKDKSLRGPAYWALRLVMWANTVVSVPLYLWFLHHMAGRGGDHVEPGDPLRFWLPIVVPLAAFSFTLLSAVSWWGSTETRPYLLGRKGWRFLIVFVSGLSLLTGTSGASNLDATAVLLTMMVTAIGIMGLWLLPAALAPQLLDTLRRNQRPKEPS